MPDSAVEVTSISLPSGITMAHAMSNPSPSYLGCPTSETERFEDRGARVRRDRSAVVVNGEPDALARFGRDGRHRRFGAMFDGVANEVAWGDAKRRPGRR